jgi:hypothetical protein
MTVHYDGIGSDPGQEIDDSFADMSGSPTAEAGVRTGNSPGSTVGIPLAIA